MPDIIVPTGTVSASSDPTIAELIALVKAQGAQLATLKKQSDGGIGKVEFRHCNVDGTRLSDTDNACPKCGSNQINSVGLGSRFMPDGQPDLVLLKQAG